MDINATQLAGVLLFLYVVHGWQESLSLEQVQKQVAAVAEEDVHPYWDEEDAEDWAKALHGALKIFQKAGCLTVHASKIELNRERILNIPELTTQFRKTNPVRFYANQILHLTPVIERLESEVIGGLNGG